MQFESADLDDHDSLASPAWDWDGALLARCSNDPKDPQKNLVFQKDRFQLAYGVYIGFIAVMIAASVIDFLCWKFLR